MQDILLSGENLAKCICKATLKYSWRTDHERKRKFSALFVFGGTGVGLESIGAELLNSSAELLKSSARASLI